MNQIPIIFLTLLMLTTDAIWAQKRNAMQWKIAGELPANNAQEKSLGVAGPVAGVHKDVLLVAGGANFPDAMPWLGGKKNYYSEGFVFKRHNDSLDCFARFQLPFPIAYTANCSTPAGIVAAGGEAEHGISNKVLLLKWNTEKQSVEMHSLPDLPMALTNAAIACKENRVYLAGGETTKEVSDRFFSLDLENTAAGWMELPSLLQPVSNAVMAVQSNNHNDCVYLVGGRKKNTGGPSTLYASVFQFDLSASKWQQKKSLPYALSAGTGIATGGNGILVFGGDRGETFHKTELLIAEIATEKDKTKKQQLNEEKALLQASHPGFSKDVLLYNTKKDKWTTAGRIPFDAPVTTTAIQWNGEVVIPSGEVKAGVRTPRILMAEVKED